METYPGMTAIRTRSSRGRYSPQTMEELSRDPLEVTHTKPIVFTLLSIFFAPLSWAGGGWPGPGQGRRQTQHYLLRREKTVMNF